MKILFFARHYGYLRNYESAIRALAERGHRIHLAADREESIGGKEMVARLTAEFPQLSHGWTPSREGDDWVWLASRIRTAADYLRYTEPWYVDAPTLRQRAESRVPISVRTLTRLCEHRARWALTLLAIFIRWAESALPRSKDLERYLAEHNPDVTLITPLIDLGSPQLDHLKAARRLGLRTVLCVSSWDHLSSKARLRTFPDLITVWNHVQEREAIDMHGVPAERVAVTGAQCYDQWFGREPSQDRESFCRELRLPPSRPYVIWLCSSLFRGSRAESELVEEWLHALRSSDAPELRNLGVLIRPHPARLAEWRRVDLSSYANVAFKGSNPINRTAKDFYFDSMAHAHAAIGLTSSSMIEAGIVGKPVLTIVDDTYSENQVGTIHFRYLVETGGGLLTVADCLDQHMLQLKALLSEPAPRSNPEFVREFIRPYGLDEAATPRFSDAIERLAASPAPRHRLGLSLAVILRPLLYLVLLFRRLRYRSKRTWKKLRKNARRRIALTKKALRAAVKRYLGQPLRQRPVDLSKAERNRLRSQKMFESLDEVEETKETIQALTAGDAPIVVGPWLSEAGFELLYWIPFLNWVKSFSNLREDRLAVVSRGGTASWYQHLSRQYFDVFDYFDEDEFRNLNESRIAQQGGNQKHVSIEDFDRAIIDKVRESLGTAHVQVLHPSLMYNLFRVFWRLHASVGLVQGYTAYRAIASPPLGELASRLPETYVAVKFYTNLSFPSTDRNVQFVASYLADLADRHEVVVLNTGVRFDDHSDFPSSVRERVHTVEDLMTPRDNLDVQTRIIGNAQAFVGTYGGFSYLAPLLGVDTLAFFSDPTMFRVDHLEIAKRVFTELGAGSFVPLDVQDVGVVRLAVGSDHGTHPVPAP